MTRPVPCYAIYRQRPDENKGEEFFHCALFHKETRLSEGERYVAGWFVPQNVDATQVPELPDPPFKAWMTTKDAKAYALQSAQIASVAAQKTDRLDHALHFQYSANPYTAMCEAIAKLPASNLAAACGAAAQELSAHQERLSAVFQNPENSVKHVSSQGLAQHARDEFTAPSLLEPVAQVCADFTLFWAGSGPIAPLVKRNNIRVGDQLVSLDQAMAYAQDYAQPYRAKVKELEASFEETVRTLKAELQAWKDRFPQHQYRPQDECVSLKFGESNAQS